MYATDLPNKFFVECFRVKESNRVILYNLCLQGISELLKEKSLYIHEKITKMDLL